MCDLNQKVLEKVKSVIRLSVSEIDTSILTPLLKSSTISALVKHDLMRWCQLCLSSLEKPTKENEKRIRKDIKALTSDFTFRLLISADETFTLTRSDMKHTTHAEKNWIQLSECPISRVPYLKFTEEILLSLL